MFLATITYYEPTGKSRETIIVANDLISINEKLQKVKHFIELMGLKFLASVIEEVEDMQDCNDSVDLFDETKQTFH